MNTTSDRMKVILSRVLSEEVAHQEIWEKQDIERFGESKMHRDEIIAEIKQFMEDNNIPFNYDRYLQV